jgi:hypothetical protein
MLQQAAGNGLQVIRDARPEEVIGHFQNVYRSQLPGIRNKDYLRLTACAGIASRDGHCAAYLAQTPDNKPSAFYLVFSDERCVYSTLGGSTEEGKKNGAFYLLTDAVIRDHADTNRTFRFEGSDLSGIAFFNSQFGSSPVIYPHITMNKLPFPVNLLKRS